MEAGQLGKYIFQMKFSDTVLIVGFGSIGRRHANNILQNTNSKVMILSNRKNIDFTEFHNYHLYKNRIQIYNNFECCIKEKPSVAFITNETSLHVDFALKLARMNVDLFIEKPLSNSMKNLISLGKIINKNNLIVMVGCNFRFYPPIMKIKEIIDKKLLGKVISVQSENSSYLPDWHPKENYTKSYAARKELGGGVTLTQIHELDFLIYIFGKINSICSIVGKFSRLKVSADDICTCIMKSKNNAIIELHLDFFSKPYYKRLKIRGTKGTLIWNSDDNNIQYYGINHRDWKIIEIENNYKLTGKKVNLMYVHELQYFLTCVQNRQTPMNNFYESVEILKTAINIKSRSMK